MWTLHLHVLITNSFCALVLSMRQAGLLCERKLRQAGDSMCLGSMCMQYRAACCMCFGRTSACCQPWRCIVLTRQQRRHEMHRPAPQYAQYEQVI